MSIQAIGNWLFFVGQQWVNSLKVFLPKNFKLFILVTLNAWWQASKTFFIYFWWVSLLYILAGFLPLQWNELQTILLGTMQIFINYILFCAIRPSIEQKDYRYFFKLVPHGLFFLIYWFFVFVPFIGIFAVLLTKTAYIKTLGAWQLLNGLSSFIYFANIFAFFFFLDSQLSIKNIFYSIIRGLKMVFYALPFCFIVGLIFYFISVTTIPVSFFVSQWPFVGLFVSIILYFVVYSLQLCVLNTFYIKRAHEDYDLYFK